MIALEKRKYYPELERSGCRKHQICTCKAEENKDSHEDAVSDEDKSQYPKQVKLKEARRCLRIKSK